MPPKKLLFICSRNRWRSPTAERVFDGVDGLQARSAGTEPGARIKVTAGHIGWADLIFVMEQKHVRRVREKFAEELMGKPLVCLNVPDDYQFMQSELVERLRQAVAPHLATDAHAPGLSLVLCFLASCEAAIPRTFLEHGLSGLTLPSAPSTLPAINRPAHGA